ncbi:MAG TPA: acyl-CoA desaturase [Candidatus Dormibacteraeota bacterium]|nr:acyl-CoA desaturase [Candidatus Dormibacteraeota bacterium]
MSPTMTTAPVSDPRRAPTDYALLKRRIRDAGLLDRQPRFYIRSVAIKLTLLAASLALFIPLRHLPWALCVNAFALALIFGQLGFQLHDAGHRQMFRQRWINTVIGLVTGNLLLGMSYGWWVDKHNRHHANPNNVSLDPDIGPGTISYSEEQALASRGLRRIVARYQAYLFFPLLFGLGWAMHVKSARFLASGSARRRWLEIGLIGVHVALYLGFFLLVLGPLWGPVAIVITQCVGGFYLASVFAPNHKGMEQVGPGVELDFLRSQVLTSRNVRGNVFTDIWYGALNHQIEHHLFPTMSRNCMSRAHGIVSDFCAERGVPFYETSMPRSYWEILVFLHGVGAPVRGVAWAPAPAAEDGAAKASGAVEIL